MRYGLKYLMAIAGLATVMVYAAARLEQSAGAVGQASEPEWVIAPRAPGQPPAGGRDVSDRGASDRAADRTASRAEVVVQKELPTDLDAAPLDAAADGAAEGAMLPPAPRATRAERIGELDALLAQEAYDQVWALSREQTLRRALDDAGDDHLQITDVACRSTLCRIDISHDHIDAEQKFIQKMSVQPGFVPDGETRVLHREMTVDGKSRIRFYLARKGSTLPG